MDRVIEEVLSRIGKAAGATRVLLQWHRTGVVVVSGQWSPPDVPPLPGHPGVPLDRVARWADALGQEGLVLVEDVWELDDSWSGERSTMLAMGVQASASIAIRGADGIAGSIVVYTDRPHRWDGALVELLEESAERLAATADAAARRGSAIAASGFHEFPLALVVLDGEGGVLAGNLAARRIGVRDGFQPRAGLDAVTDISPESAARIESALAPILAGDVDRSRTVLQVWGADVEILCTAVGEGVGREILVAAFPLSGAVDHADLDVAALVADGGIEAAYQPMIGRDGRPVGAEALCRIVDPRYASLEPELLVARAERAGSISHLDRWMLARALSDLPALSGGRPFHLSVNLGVDTLLTGIADHAAELADTAGVARGSIQFEITETTELHDPRAIAELVQLHDAGFLLALDDFGSGYSAFTYITELPIDRVKLDRSLIQRGAMEERAALVVHRVTALAEDLGLEHLAEGVETPGQLELVRDVGSLAWQGFLCSAALPVADFVVRMHRSAPSGVASATWA